MFLSKSKTDEIQDRNKMAEALLYSGTSSVKLCGIPLIKPCAMYFFNSKFILTSIVVVIDSFAIAPSGISVIYQNYNAKNRQLVFIISCSK